MLAKVILFLYC